eukprot:13137610-Ditylum_brightwellii.AAC.1
MLLFGTSPQEEMVLQQPSNKKVWSFWVSKENLYPSDSTKIKDEDVEFMEIRYRFQKNKDNGETIKYSESSNLKLCPVNQN